MPTTLPDAILERLRASAVAGLVGDTYDPTTGLGTVRVGFDYLGPGSLPYVVILEPGEGPRTYFTAGGTGGQPYIVDGSVSVECHHPEREAAKALGKAVSQSLNDADLTWTDGRIMHLRAMSFAMTPVSDVGTGSPTLFVQSITFAFTYQGAV